MNCGNDCKYKLYCKKWVKENSTIIGRHVYMQGMQIYVQVILLRCNARGAIMRRLFTVCVIVVAALILLTGCRNEQVPHFTADASITVDPGTLERIRITLPEEISRERISDIQDDFVLNDQQVGGIVLVDIPEELLDAPMKGLFEITELLRQQLMPDVPAKEAEAVSWGGSQNAYMELAVGPDDITYFHYLFRGTNNTYDVWFNWKLLNQDSDIIYEIVNSVAGEDILQVNNQNPF